MKPVHYILFLLLIFCMGFTNIYPELQNKDKVYRIAYVEGGSYNEYFLYFVNLLKRMADAHLIHEILIPYDLLKSNDMQRLWEFISKKPNKNIQFVKDAFYSAGWDNSKYNDVQSRVLLRLQENKDIDLVLANGTVAGQMFINHNYSTPVINFNANDPIKAGISKSLEVSGFPYLTTQIIPQRSLIIYSYMYYVFKPTKVGILFEDSTNGRNFAAVDVLESLAIDNNFTVEKCNTIDDSPNINVSRESVKKCIKKLVHDKVDVLIFTPQNGFNQQNFYEFIKYPLKNKIPTFYSAGSDFEVSHGILLTIDLGELNNGPVDIVNRMINIFNGTPVSCLNQVLIPSISLLVNTEVLRRIEYTLPDDVLGTITKKFEYLDVN